MTPKEKKLLKERDELMMQLAQRLNDIENGKIKVRK
jgi:hypothetical protein